MPQSKTTIEWFGLTAMVFIAVVAAIGIGLVMAPVVDAPPERIEGHRTTKTTFGKPDSCGPGWRCVMVPNE